MKKIFTGKLLKLMKLSATQWILTMVFAGVAMAHSNYAQLLRTEVSVTFSGISLEQALSQLEKLTGAKFLYSIDQLGVDEPITFTAEHMALGDVLDAILTPYRIRYQVHEKSSSITLKRERVQQQTSVRVDSRNDLPVRNTAAFLMVSGIVRDAATNDPIPGVNILIRGTAIGTATGADGSFTIDASRGDVLVFSFIGYESVEHTVGNETTLTILMKEITTSLDEVVINAGYYQTTRWTQTGNISKIEAKDIEHQPVGNVLAAMMGRVPGLEIIQSTGVPGGNFQVRIRGTNSIANGNDPLIIIDGVPFLNTTMAFNESSIGIYGDAQGNGGVSPLNAINPNDIESIEVLKDADATAIYGSRGANGVILITTKRGAPGKPGMDITYYTGAGKVASRMDLMNSEEFIAMQTAALADAGIAITPQSAPYLTVWDPTSYTDWQDVLIGGTANTTDAQLSFSGGDEHIQFRLSGGYHKEDAVFPGDGSDRRLSASVSLTNVSENNKLRNTFSFKYVNGFTDLIQQDLTRLALTLPPVAPPLYKEDGSLNWGTEWESNSWTAAFQHPLRYLNTTYESATNNVLMDIASSYNILPNLDLKLTAGFSQVAYDAMQLTPKSSLPPSIAPDFDNEAVFSESTFKNWNIEPQINWYPQLGPGKLNLLLGTTFLNQVTDGLSQYAKGFSDESLMKNIAAAAEINQGTNYYSQYRYNAFFGRINYAFQERYILNLTGRRDGSSRFGPGKQFANFWAVGAAWIFSKENFIGGASSILSFGKLRMSYGVTGNDQIGEYQYMDTYTSSGEYQGKVGLAPVRLANPDFAWETNHKLEMGLEAGFWNNRIMTSLSIYRNRSSNQLVGQPLPPTTGFEVIQENMPATVQNSGVEFELSSENIDRTDFSWTTRFTISIPRNKLVEFPNLENSPFYANTLVVGEPLTIMKHYHCLGVDPQTGLFVFEDTNDDGSINSIDRTVITFNGQKYYGGLHNSFTYKRLQLDIYFQYVKQARTNFLGTFFSNPGAVIGNQPVWVQHNWREPGDHADYQKFTAGSEGQQAYNLLVGSDRYVSDASFIRLKNVAVSYRIDKSQVRGMPFRNLRVFVQGQNLLTITNYLGLDPETLNHSVPPLRTIAAGVQVSL